MPNGFHAPNTHVKEFTLGSNYAKKVMCPIAIYSMPDETYDMYLGLRSNRILINIFVGEKNADELIEFCDYDSF